MNRRQFLLAGAVASAAMVTGVAVRRSTQPAANMAGLMTELEALRGKTLRSRAGWSPFKVLTHLAQSIEFSMTGYPALKSPLFRHTAGPAAFFAFSTAGAMKHPLTEPILGAPQIADDGDVDAALKRLLLALQSFSAWQGPLAPHFAYGELDKAAYAQAHVMHIKDHWRALAVNAMAA